MKALQSLQTRNPLPNGAITVGIGLGLSGVCTYVFLAIADHAIGADLYSLSFSNFWSLLFIVAPGIFLPLEQELGRAIAARRTRGDGGAPVIERVGVIGASFLILLLIAGAALSGLIDRDLLHGDGLLMIALLLGMCAYCAEHLSRGTLSGNSRFAAYGILLGSEGVYRVLFCTGLAVAHVRTPGWYGIAVVAGSFAAVLTALARQRGLMVPGSHSTNAEVTFALGPLLIASLATQFLFNGGTVMVTVLESPSDTRAAGTFLNGRILAFVPLFLFQAVAAALLPRLAALRSRGMYVAFRRTLARLLLMVGAIGVVGVAGAYVAGPTALRLIFGPEFNLAGRDLALLAASCTALMAAQALAQGMIAGSHYWGVVTGWLTGVAVFFAVIVVVHPLLLRVELALACGGLAAAAVMAALQTELWRLGDAAAAPVEVPAA
ncbi:MAG: polysaccharide biosynthesis protein [Candidatus Dormibacteria bacterium]